MSGPAARHAGIMALVALFVLQFAWHVWLDPPAPALRAATWSLALLPLAAILAYCVRSPRRGLLAGGFVVLPYFVHGVVATLDAGRWRALAALEVLLAVGVVGAIGAATLIEKRARPG